MGLFFLRTNTKAITTANVASETFFGALESNGGGLLEAVETLLSRIFLPALKEQTNWGALSSGADGHMQKEAFLNKLSSFIAVLANARASIADAVKLSPCQHEGLAPITTPAEILAAAGNPDLVEAAEACTLTWCKEMEQILTQSEQMRRESDDVGPRAELEHWKKRMAKFDSLTTSIKSPQCRAIINILVAAKSKVLQVIEFSHLFMCGECEALLPSFYLPPLYLPPLSLPSSIIPPSSLHPPLSHSPSLPPLFPPFPSLPSTSLPLPPYPLPLPTPPYPPSSPPSLPCRPGRTWTSPSLTTLMKLRTTSSSCTLWRGTVSLSTTATQ